MSELSKYSLDELSKRNGNEMKDVWVGYKGLIYDVTSSDLFEKGKHYFHDAGMDLTAEMEDAPHLDDVMSKFPIVGKIDSTSSSISKPNEKVKTYSGKIIEINDLSRTTREIHILPKESFIYQSGQYINISIPSNESIWRSYSIASIPEEKIIKFIIRYREKGIASHYLFDDIEVNDSIDYRGPYGKFIVPSSMLINDYIFICSDISISSVLPIIQEQLITKKTLRKIHVIHQGNYFPDLIYYETLKQLSDKFVNFNYHPILARELSKNWGGQKGKSEEILDNLSFNRSNTAFYVCGWIDFVQKTMEKLNKMGIEKIKIKSEIYS